MSKVLKKTTPKRSNTDLIVLICIVSAALVCVAIVIGINISNINNKNNDGAEFVPPEFEDQATFGKPTVPDGMGYLEVYKEGMDFNSFVCGEVIITNGQADLYFTNPKENTLWMKLRIFDETGNIIAETGLIKPDQYLKTVVFDKVPSNNSKIIMKIMTYEPETYYSGGAVSLSTVATVK